MVIKAKREKLTLSQVKGKVRKLKTKLKQEKIPFSALLIFGSYARGNAHIDSDIDVAVVLPAGLNALIKKRARQIPWWAKQVDVKLEAHLLSERDMSSRWLSLPAEIRKTGLKV